MTHHQISANVIEQETHTDLQQEKKITNKSNLKSKYINEDQSDSYDKGSDQLL